VAVGTWGPGVFSSDGALDVRDAFRELIGTGYDVADATARVVEVRELDDQPDCAPDWIALAVTQWKTGRLLDWVRDRAISVIDAGPGEWADAKIAKRRAVVLRRVRAQLLSPQTAPTRVRPPRFSQTPFRPGDVLRYACSTGREVGLWAITNERHETLTTTSVDTLFELLAFGEPTLPALDELLAAPPLHTGRDAITGRVETIQLVLVYPQDAVGPRWTVLANRQLPPGRTPDSGHTVVPTKRADQVFRSWYERLVGTQTNESA
jgi:hypothetical protein